MYGDFERLEEMKKKLDEVSSSFCMAKWMHGTVHLMTGRTHSCYLPPTHKIPLGEIKNDPAALHNTKEKKIQRKMMKEGKRPEGCQICWNVEDLPGEQVSDRHYRALESWTLPYFDQVKEMKWDENINPSYLEVSFSSSCNLRCCYCSPEVSTAWEKEIKQHGPYQLKKGTHQEMKYLEMPMKMDEDENPYVAAFWKWWPSLKEDLHYFRITGGEPLLSPNTFRIMERIAAEPTPNMSLNINSNFSVTDRQIDKFFKLLKPLEEKRSIRNFMLHTSVDAFGAQAEYIRDGLDFKRFEKNINRFLEEFPYCSVSFMCTFNALSVTSFKEFLAWVLDLKKRFYNGKRDVYLDTPHLMAPTFFSMKILTSDYIEMVEDCVDFMASNLRDHEQGVYGFSEAELAKLKRVVETMREKESNKWIDRNRADFYLFFEQHDKRRGTNFFETFPRLERFWSLCKASVRI
jgi:organic radical activating enzyme